MVTKIRERSVRIEHVQRMVFSLNPTPCRIGDNSWISADFNRLARFALDSLAPIDSPNIARALRFDSWDAARSRSKLSTIFCLFICMSIVYWPRLPAHEIVSLTVFGVVRGNSRTTNSQIIFRATTYATLQRKRINRSAAESEEIHVLQFISLRSIIRLPNIYYCLLFHLLVAFVIVPTLPHRQRAIHLQLPCVASSSLFAFEYVASAENKSRHNRLFIYKCVS